MTRKRTKPYTQLGIKRLRCFRCGARRPTQQWNICSDGNQYRAICDACDVALNRLVLVFMGFPNVDEMMRRYEARMALQRIVRET